MSISEKLSETGISKVSGFNLLKSGENMDTKIRKRIENDTSANLTGNGQKFFGPSPAVLHYAKQIQSIPVLTQEEELECLNVFLSPTSSETAKRKARDSLIIHNLRFVMYKSGRIHGGNHSLQEDLISAGNFALFDAANTFDVSRGGRFINGARWHIQNALLEELNESYRIVPIPKKKYQLSARIEKLKQKYHRPITLQELKAAFPEEKEEHLDELNGTRYFSYSIEQMLENGAEESTFVLSVEDTLIDDIDKERMKKLFQMLPSPLREVMDMHFGVTDEEGMSKGEVCRQLSMTMYELNNLLNEGLDKLKRLMETRNLVV